MFWTYCVALGLFSLLLIERVVFVGKLDFAHFQTKTNVIFGFVGPGRPWGPHVWVCLVPKTLVNYMSSFWCYLDSRASQLPYNAKLHKIVFVMSPFCARESSARANLHFADCQLSNLITFYNMLWEFIRFYNIVITIYTKHIFKMYNIYKIYVKYWPLSALSARREEVPRAGPGPKNQT